MTCGTAQLSAVEEYRVHGSGVEASVFPLARAAMTPSGVITAHSRPGHCPRCGLWLGGESAGEAQALQNLAADQQIAARVYGFLGSGPAALAAARSSAFSQNIGTLKNVLFNGNAQGLARFIGVNRFTVMVWAGDKQLPSLLSLEDLSLKMGITPDALVSKRVQPEEFIITLPPRGGAAPAAQATAQARS